MDFVGIAALITAVTTAVLGIGAFVRGSKPEKAESDPSGSVLTMLAGQITELEMKLDEAERRAELAEWRLEVLGGGDEAP